MKNIELLTNTDRAKLLHQLFPEEIPAFLEFTTKLCQSIKEDETNQRAQWKNGLFTFGFWLHFVRQAEDNISHNRNQIIKSSSRFAENLFDGYLAMYSSFALQQYLADRQHPNPKFILAVDLFFNP